MLVDSIHQPYRTGAPASRPPKQVLVISATERETNTILTTLSARQRTEALLVAANIVRNMFTNPILHD
ncbi:MAG TPA: hypothetical protein G4N94_00080 [Caldilineae bacterium]|nr:hypothetical protein [Caldilineae bacterium]